MPFARTSAVLTTALALAFVIGCSAITRPAPVRETYVLVPPLPPALAQSRPGGVRIGNISVAAPFRGKAFVYRVGDLRFESDFYVEFLVPPAAMLTEQTARALASAKPYARIVGPGTAADAQWVLDGFASALYADTREPGKPAAVLTITYHLTPAGGSAQVPVWTHEFHKRIPMRDASQAAYAEALNRAFGEIVAELARALASVETPKH